MDRSASCSNNLRCPHVISRAGRASLCCLFIIVIACLPGTAFGQATLHGTLKTGDGETLPGATVQLHYLLNGEDKFIGSDVNGSFAFSNLHSGKYALTVSSVGFATYHDTIELARDQALTVTIAMEEESVSEKEVVVSASRVARDVDDIPFRVELIPADDLDESITMGLNSAKAVLGELPGVMAQTTSAGLGASTVRLHGLDGRYSQILVDGVPAFGGLNMNFSVIQLPPLNLKQLEIIKGSSAGLHSDAIGGIVNYITKTPARSAPEVTAVANYTSFDATDLAGFYGQRFDHVGLSLHTTYNYAPRRDVDGDGFADVPYQRRYNINPKLTYAFSPQTQISVAGNVTNEDRLGGFMSAPLDLDRGDTSVFSAALKTRRVDGEVSFSSQLDQHTRIGANAEYAQTQRNSYRQGIPFDGMERVGYIDAQWSKSYDQLQVLLGMSNLNQRFFETTKDYVNNERRGFAFNTYSVFSQLEYAFSPDVSGMLNLRMDHNNIYGNIISPRLSLMVKPANDLSVRGSVGTGWRGPTLFSEDAEDRGYYLVHPLYQHFLGPVPHESAYSYSIDSRYVTSMKGWKFTTDINLYAITINPEAELARLPTPAPYPGIYLDSYGAIEESKGVELIFEARTETFSAFFGYTYSDVTKKSSGIEGRKLLTPSHFINGALLWEIPKTVRFVCDFMLESPQLLPANPYITESPTVTTVGSSAEFWLTKNISIFVNAENLFDFRQTEVMPLYLPTSSFPSYSTNVIWGPVEGRVTNGGIKFSM
ncbi:MAG TPA: TonB-dependent receptor [Bacteroidota bacterium]|nr:TonB-dependent receptor [Bacteroidota bacterium]